MSAFPQLQQEMCSCSALTAPSLTRVAIVGHPELPLQGPIVATELQLQQQGVVPHFSPLDVDWRLLLASTVWEVLSPVLFVQLSFSWRGGEGGDRGVGRSAVSQESENSPHLPAGNANLIIVTRGAAAIKGCFAFPRVKIHIIVSAGQLCCKVRNLHCSSSSVMAGD